MLQTLAGVGLFVAVCAAVATALALALAGLARLEPKR